MPYTTFSTEEILQKYDREKNALFEMIIRHPELSQQSIEKLSEPLRLLEAELRKRGKLP
ncbi:MAG: hypothetical protein JNK79_01090 [Chitinophagaceae bacterium]|nr:hypothetical protein [Chitinophagaceae bacterium]